MPTRTYLTTPPGRTPSQATGRSASEDGERYVPGLGAPSEPDPPSRWRTPVIVLATVAVVVLLVALVLRLSAATQAQDPALDPAFDGGPAGREGPTLRDSIPGVGDTGEDGATEDGAP